VRAEGGAPAFAVDGARIARADSADSANTAEAADWPSHGRGYFEQRYSPLDQIHSGNVARLAPAWVYTTGETRGHEATPIVVDGVLFATSTWSIVFALDAKTGRELWRYDPKVPRWKGRDACCDAVNRGVAVWQGRVYVGALDGRLIALDARTGTLRWEVQTTDPAKSYTITGAPRVVKDLVVIGNGGAEFGVRGYFSAYDAATGALRWRFYTVPAKPGTKDAYTGVEAGTREDALARASWSADSAWEFGLGGTAWDAMAFDPALDLLYVGVGNSSPYDRDRRSPGGGDNLFLSSIVAVRPDTGRLVWHYQTTPGENWDYTATQHIMLVDREWGEGAERRLRKLLVQAPKNGFFYVLDRETGELLAADPYVFTSWASHVDLATGRPVEKPGARWNDGSAMVSPSVIGGHNWHPMAFHPKTGLVYLPSQQAAYPFHVERDSRFVPGGRFNTGEDLPAMAKSLDGYERAVRFCDPTHLTAWDPVARKQAWRVAHASETNGGALATGRDLVFQGSGTGRFVAYHAATGEQLWVSDVGIGVMAGPVSYEVDGEQYVAVLAGIGGSSGLHLSVIDYVNRGTVIAYKLGGTAALPAVEKRDRSRVAPPMLEATPAQLERGRELYGWNCWRCHGVNANATGVLPDLRLASRAVHEQWSDIVLGGTRQARGMPSFATLLSREDALAVQAFVAAQALREPSVLESAASWLSERVCVPAEWATD